MAESLRPTRSQRTVHLSEMRPIHELYLLETDVLQKELGEVSERLARFLDQEAVAVMEFERTNLNRYFSSGSESHAAKQREADYHSLQEREDVLTFTKEVKALTLIRDYLIRLIEWRQ